MGRRRRLAVLLPPSEGKAPGGDGPGWATDDGTFGSSLADQRLAVAKALADVGGGDERLLGVKGKELARAQAANVALLGAPTLPAWQRYTGVVWDHLDVGSLPAAARRRAASSLVIVSALAGLAALDDPLPDHRCKLSVSLGELGRLDRFWSPALSPVLDDHLAGRTVVDLLPQEHAAAWQPDPSRYRLLRVRFVAVDGRVAGHTAKAAKGLLARALVEATDPDDVLDGWAHEGLRAEVTDLSA